MPRNQLSILPASVDAYKHAVRRARRSALMWALVAGATMTLPGAVVIALAATRLDALRHAGGGDPIAVVAIAGVIVSAMRAFACLALFSARRCVEDRKLAAAYEHSALLCTVIPETSRARQDGSAPLDRDVTRLQDALNQSNVHFLGSSKDETLPVFSAAKGIQELLARRKSPARAK